METLFDKEQILLRMRRDNPWWASSSIPSDYSAMPHRAYFDIFLSIVQDTSLRRGVILMGPRRVGKTVMIYHAIEELIKGGVDPQKIIYLSVDTPIYNYTGLESLLNLSAQALKKEISQEETYYVFYDEIQYLNDWEIHLKSLIDSYRNVKFVASGSATAALKTKSIESGAGRFTDFMLPPLTFYEYIHMLKLDNILVPSSLIWNDNVVDMVDAIDIDLLNEHFLEYINYGGYPEVLFSDRIRLEPTQFIKHDIVDKVLLRDLPSLYGIQDTNELYRFFVHLVYLSGSEFSYDSLSKSTNIKKDTLKKYIQYLETAFLIKVVYKVDENARRFQRERSFKIYLTNPAMRCALFNPITINDNYVGNMVETAIYAQWIQRDNMGIHYANWKRGRTNGEVDMVGLDTVRQTPKWVVEIKWTDRFYDSPGELESLFSFMQFNSLPQAIVTSISKYGRKDLKEVGLQFIPSAIYAYIIGRNTILHKRVEL